GKACNIVRLDAGQFGSTHFHVVNQNEWINLIAKGGYTPDEKVRVILSGLTTSLVGDHSGNPSRQCSGEITGGHVEFRRIYRGDCSHHIGPFLGSEGDYHHVIQLGGGFDDGDIDHFAAFYRYFLSLKSDDAENQNRRRDVCRYFQNVFAIQVRAGP